MRRRSALVLAGLTAGLVACGGPATTGDFKREAEKFIESDTFAETPDVGMVVTDVECIEPESTAISTTFTCVGTGPDGQPVTLDAEITGERKLAVGLPSAPGPASSVAPTTVATTVPP
ncbi:MAG: hypothetical protein ABW122_02750 [Ilumatobacteraceae bacterium]